MAANDPLVARLRSLVREVLLPAYKAFDQDESAALRSSLSAESAREGQSSQNISGGARTELAVTGMHRKARQQRRVLRALLAHLQMDAPWHIRDDLFASTTRPSFGNNNWLLQVWREFRAIVPDAAWRLYRVADEDMNAEDVAVLESLMGNPPSPNVPLLRSPAARRVVASRFLMWASLFHYRLLGLTR